VFQNTPRNVYNSKTGCCPECSQNKKEDCYRWKGGNSELKDILRHYTLEWQIESRKFYNSKCLISNTYGKDLHHVFKGFNEIYYETLINCGYDNVTHYNYRDFTSDELDKLKEELLRLHNLYGYGVPMEAKLHKEFHDIYGRGNNTVDQYIEFAASKGVKITIVEKNNIKLLSIL